MLCDKSVAPAGAITFHSMVDVGTLHLHHHHQLLLVLFVSWMLDGSRMPISRGVYVCDMVFLLNYPTNFDKKRTRK